MENGKGLDGGFMLCSTSLSVDATEVCSVRGERTGNTAQGVSLGTAQIAGAGYASAALLQVHCSLECVEAGVLHRKQTPEQTPKQCLKVKAAAADAHL